MKILILTPWCDDLCLKSVKGMPLNAFLLDKLIEKGHKVSIFCTLGEKDECSVALNKISLPYFSCPSPLIYFVNMFLYFRHSLLIYKTLRVKIDEEKPDVILNIAHFGTLALKRLSIRRKIPLVLLVYGIFDLKKPFLPTKFIPYFQNIFGFLLKPDKMITINDGSAPKEWLTKTLKLPANKIAEITNPRPLWSIKKKQSSDSITIGYFSRFNYEKRTDLFIEIVHKVLEKYNNVNFIIAGGGALEQEIRKLQADFPEKVVYRGWLNYNQMRELYKEINILISTVRYANGGLQVIEAQSCGIPVIAFNVADTKRFILDGKTGLLTTKLTVEEFVSKIAMLVEDSKIRENMGNSAKEFIINTFPDTKEWVDFIVSELEKVK